MSASCFQKLFAVNPKDIKEDVIITPFLNLEYFKRNKDSKIHKGMLFSVLSEDNFSAIKTGIGASFVGDTIVYLKDTPCKRLYFVGSCGAVSGLNIADLVIPNKILARESFSDILNNKENNLFIDAKNELKDKFLESNKEIKKVNLSTISSLSLEEGILDILRQKEIDAVDMECSAFFSAVNFFKLQSLALLYVTDIIKDKPFFRDLNKQEEKIIRESRQKVISLICKFIQSQNA